MTLNGAATFYGWSHLRRPLSTATGRPSSGPRYGPSRELPERPANLVQLVLARIGSDGQEVVGLIPISRILKPCARPGGLAFRLLALANCVGNTARTGGSSHATCKSAPDTPADALSPPRQFSGRSGSNKLSPSWLETKIHDLFLEFSHEALFLFAAAVVQQVPEKQPFRGATTARLPGRCQFPRKPAMSPVGQCPPSNIERNSSSHRPPDFFRLRTNIEASP
jgi:hypothetical protein